MSDPTDKQIAEAAARYSLTQNPMTAETQQDIVDDFTNGARWVLAARQVPEDLAALVAEARGYTTDRARQNPEGAVDIVRRLAAALEVSSRTVAPNREALAKALEGLDVHMQAGVPSHIILGRYEAGQIANAVAATDLWQPAPVIDRDALRKVSWTYPDGTVHMLSSEAINALLASGWQPASPRTEGVES